MRRINKKKERRNSLLNNLEEESWQLELIVSSVVIFLLLGAYVPFRDFSSIFTVLSMGNSEGVTLLRVLLSFLWLAYQLLIGVFVLHLTMRGLWIGAIGLRSVSGGFDYNALDYPPRFSGFLRKRLGTFDDYIENLEKHASVAFSFSFLLFFSVIGVGLFFIVMFGGLNFMAYLLRNAPVINGFPKAPIYFITVVTVLCLAFMTILGVIYVIDFISAGWFKRRKWFHKVYYPFYRFMGWITLARLYRPFYYNIIDNEYGKRMIRVYASISFVIIMASGLRIVPFPNFPYKQDTFGVISTNHYLNTADYRHRPALHSVSIASRYVEKDYLELFVPTNVKKTEKIIAHRFPDLKKLTPSTMHFAGKGLKNSDIGDVNSTLNALSEIHRLYLNDSLITNIPWQFYQHPVRKQPGLLYDIPVYNLPRGEHQLRLEVQAIQRPDSLFWKQDVSISFLK
jgi:hypothetical protein